MELKDVSTLDLTREMRQLKSGYDWAAFLDPDIVYGDPRKISTESGIVLVRGFDIDWELKERRSYIARYGTLIDINKPPMVN